MFVALRIVSLLLIVIALMLLGADLVTTLEKGGEITVRSLYDVWAMFNQAGANGFNAWLEHTLPAPTPSWIEAILGLPGWAVFGVIGVILAFLFGRRTEEAA